MDELGQTAATETGAADCAMLIAVSFYKNEHLVAPLLNSLCACGAELLAIGCELVCYNDSPDYAPLAAALDAMLPLVGAQIPCRLETNKQNIGFVRTMNLAVAEAVGRRADLLLLNSDTVVEPGALSEMAAVARLDHMIGFVNPRSNNATIATLPLRDPPARHGPGAREAYGALARMLPRFSFVPTAVGFCMLIRWAILAEFGGFDEIYGKGYNEENDLVMRAGRCGYRAVLANYAFVWHEGEESFAGADISRDVWEPTNRAILDSRYPEYGRHTHAHYSMPETVAEHLLAATFPDGDGKRDIAFDFSSFRAAHNGTFEAGRQLLRVTAEIWGDAFRIHVVCVEDVYAFHGYAALGIARADPHDGAKFAAIFRVGQPYDWNAIERMMPSGAVVGVYMLDTISIDCPQLASPPLFNMWQLTIDHAEIIATQSRQTRDQFRRRFTIPADAIELVSYHALDLNEYHLPGAPGEGAQISVDGNVLVLGNHFHHKRLSHTANALADAFPDRTIVAMGPDYHGARGIAGPMDPAPLSGAANLRIVEVGALAEEDIGTEYQAAQIVVFPSHAEGFGFPLFHALAARRPVFVRRLPVFEELRQATGDNPNIHFFDSTTDLIERLQTPPCWEPHADEEAGNGAVRSAREIRNSLLLALERVDYGRIVRRLRAVQLSGMLLRQNELPPPSDTKAALAARYVALKVERIMLRLLQVRSIYASARLFFRGWKKARGR
jgi:hypothetical protein